MICDKGLDSIHGYQLDLEQGMLTQVSETFVEASVHPRYGAFHLTLPVFYQNCENSVFVHVWNYDSKTGTLRFLQSIDCQGSNPRGLCLSPDSRYLFSLNRDSNNIARFKRLEGGILEAAGAETECQLPGNMQFVVYDN